MTDYGFDGRKKEKDEIIFLSSMSAVAVLGYIFITKLYVKAVSYFGLKRLVAGTELAEQSFTLVVTVLSILIPFLFVGFFEKKKAKIDLVPLDKPENPVTLLLAVPSGVAVCIAGSYVTSLISSVFSVFGVTLTQPDVAAPPQGYALLIYLIRLTLSAAVVEEVCFRGIIMQPLRKYGNTFAIIASSFVFAAMHCNLVQAPSAFISGLGIGYFTVITGTLWTGILIHLCNNLIVAAEQYILATAGEEAVVLPSYIITSCAVTIGVLCLIVFFVRRKRLSPDTGRKTVLTAKEKFKAYYLTAPMLAALLIIAWLTGSFIEL